MLEAVSDAGPLIHLDEVGLLEALHVVRRITVPTVVADEIRAMPRGPGVAILRKRHVHVTRPSREESAAADALSFRRLSHPDRIALVMAQTRDAPLLSDDMDLRDAARTLGVDATGTVGLIVRAARTGLLEHNEAVHGLRRLIEDSSMFVTRTVVERAIRGLE